MTNEHSLPLLTPRVVAAVAVGCGLLMALLAPGHLKLAVAAWLAVMYVPLVLLDLSIGIAGWVALTFVQSLSVVSVAPTFAQALIMLAWIGVLSGGRERIAHILARERALFAAAGALFVWLGLSLLWARNAGVGWTELNWWLLALLGFLVIATALPTQRAVCVVLAGYILGGAVSVVVGLVANSLSSNASAIQTSTEINSRLAGGVGDPNYLAAALVPTVCVAIGVIAVTKRALPRFLCGVGLVLALVGIAVSESRGGLLAAIVAAAAALVFARRRAAVVAVLGVVVAIFAFFVATSPGALKRLTTVDPTGDGRSDLWLVATRMWKQSPLNGVGLNNYQVRAREFVRQPGGLTKVRLIAEQPHVVHNVYLQMLAETGIVGLALLLAVIAFAVSSTLRAVRLCDARGSPKMAVLARSVLVGQIGLLTASFFISDGSDPRLWALLAIGPALRAMAVPDAVPVARARFGRALPAAAPVIGAP